MQVDSINAFTDKLFYLPKLCKNITVQIGSEEKYIISLRRTKDRFSLLYQDDTEIEITDDLVHKYVLYGVSNCEKPVFCYEVQFDDFSPKLKFLSSVRVINAVLTQNKFTCVFSSPFAPNVKYPYPPPLERVPLVRQVGLNKRITSN